MGAKHYEVGYGKPPLHTRFKKGQCPNPMGRGARKALVERVTFLDMMNRSIVYSVNGKRKTATRLELLIRRQLSRALKGDVRSAMTLLKLHSHFPGSSYDDEIRVIFTGGPMAREEDGCVKVPDGPGS